MSSLKVILESHPIKNLNGIIKSVKSELAPKLALSKDKKRHSKETLIDHILKLDKMGLLKERPSMYEKPVRAKKVKAEVKAEPKKDKKKQLKEAIKKGKKIIESKKQEPKPEVDLEKAKKAGIKVDLSKVDVVKEEKKKRKPSSWNLFVKAQGGVKNAIANKSKYKK